MSPLLIPVALLVLVFTFLLIRTLQLQHPPDNVQEIEKPTVDRAKISRELSSAIRIPTISRAVMQPQDRKPFTEMHAWITESYPNISEQLERTVINEYSLLYKWQGSESRLRPVLFNAHMDVVPVEEQTLKEWKVDPFEGAVREWYVWGRGALDMKSTLVGLLHSAEKLLAEGYQPKRTIYLAFGHDEEIMGFEGTVKIVDHLKKKNVKLAALLDEGGMVSLDAVEGVDEPVALVGNTEKGYLTLRVSAEGAPGHSSRPPRQTAIGIVARALAVIDDNPMPATVDYFLPTLRKVGYVLPFGLQFAVANADIFGKTIVRRLEKKPETNGMLRTTHAATVISGGIKDNVLPARAEAKVNMRLLPGDTIEKVIDHFKKAVNDPRVEFEIDRESGAWEASSVAPISEPPFLTLELVIRQMFGNVPTAPFVFMAATDSRYYQPVCDHIFKFSPHRISSEERKSVHGINERISQDELVNMAAFFQRLMKVWGEAEF